MEKILHKIEGSLFQQVDFRERIYLADSFVSVPQKLDKGNGEAKLYVGNESENLRNFLALNLLILNVFLKK